MGSMGALPECQVCLEEQRRLVELPCACDFRLCEPCVRRLRPDLKCPQCRVDFRESDTRTLAFGAVECWECGRDERAEYALWCEPCHRLLCFDCLRSSTHASHTTHKFQKSMGSVMRWVAEELESEAEEDLRRLGRAFLPVEVLDQDAKTDLASRLRQAADLGDRPSVPRGELRPLVGPPARLRCHATRLLRFLGGEPAAEEPGDSLSAVLDAQGPAAAAEALRDRLRREAASGFHHKTVQTTDTTDAQQPTTRIVLGQNTVLIPCHLLLPFPVTALPDRPGEVILALSGSGDKVQWFIRGFHPDKPVETRLAPLGLSGKCRCVAVGSWVFVRDAQRTWELRVIGPGRVMASVPPDDPIKPPTESAEILKLLLLPSGKILAAWAGVEALGWVFTVDGKSVLPPVTRQEDSIKMELVGLHLDGNDVHVLFEEWTGVGRFDCPMMWRRKMNLSTKTSSVPELLIGDPFSFRFGPGISTAIHEGKLVIAGGEDVSLVGLRAGGPSSRVVFRDGVEFRVIGPAEGVGWDADVPKLLYPQFHLPLLRWHGELVGLGWAAGLGSGFVQLEALHLGPDRHRASRARDRWAAPDRLDAQTADFVIVHFHSK